MKFLLEQESTINRDRAQARARKDLESLSNYNQYLRQAQFEYLRTLSNINNEDLRAKYLDYLSKLKISFSPETVELINKLQNQKKVNIYDQSSFINDPRFFNDEDDADQRNKIKVYTYFSDEKNANDWGFSSSQEALKNLKDENGNWKSYKDVASWIEEVNEESGKTDSNDEVDPRLIKQALEVIESMGIKEKEANKLLAKLGPMLNPDITDAEIADMILKVR